LHGDRGATIACAAYVLCPNLCAHGSIVGTDSGVAVMMLLATDRRVLGKFTVHRWLKLAGWLAMATMAAAVVAMLIL
jgi:Mn2+/Fe2+ NRAMP family transporter